jgi:N-formylglutamate amidohydrolase
MAGNQPPILITTPHGSGEIPSGIFARMRECGEPAAALRKRILSEGDPFTDQLYDLPAQAVLRAAHSRFVVDLNRERNEGGPNGVIKTTDFQLRPLYASGYRMTAEERERRLREYYDPYHREIEERLARGGIRFLLDGHSMTAQGPVLGPDQGHSRPALCLCNFGDAGGEAVGGEPVSFDPALARAVREHAAKILGSSFPDWKPDDLVLLNQPFEGGCILRRYTHPSHPHCVPGLMFEINRSLYLDEEKLEPLPGAVEIWRNFLLEITRFILTAL